jgi:hypothetical protein
VRCTRRIVRHLEALHEDGLQLLSTLLIRLQVARRATDPVQREAALDALREDVAASAEAIRAIAINLATRPESDRSYVDRTQPGG